MINLKRAKPSDVKAMQMLVLPQVEAGVILARSDDEVASNIRSYVLATKCDKKDSVAKKQNCPQIATQNKQNDEIIGFGALHIISPDLAEIRSLIVSPKHQKMGIGSQIVKELIKEAKELGLKKVFSLTYAQEFFESLGFKMIEKNELPAQKIWSDCVKCKHFPICDEKALMLYL